MITRQEFEGLIQQTNRMWPNKREIPDVRSYYLLGISKALYPKRGTPPDPVHYLESKERIEELLNILFPPASEPPNRMEGRPSTGQYGDMSGLSGSKGVGEKEAPFKIMVGGLGEQEVLIAREFLIKEIGGFSFFTPIVKTRMNHLLEREAERQRFLAWLEDECDEMSKVPKDIPQLSKYLDRWLCKE